ncbi:hypothetical protein D9M69_666510 [compost metagenome]
MAKRLAGVHVGDVALDHRQWVHALDGVVQRHGGVGQRTGVDHHTQGLALLVEPAVFVDLVQQRAFPVALQAFHFVADLLAMRLAERLHVGQGGVPVLRGLARAEQVEVGAVEDEDLFHGRRMVQG